MPPQQAPTLTDLEEARAYVEQRLGGSQSNG